MSTPAVAALSFDASMKSQRTAPGVDTLAQSCLVNQLLVPGRTPERATVNEI